MAMSRAGRKRLIVVLGAVVLGAGAAGAWGIKQARLARNMETWLADGNAAYQRGDYATALELLSQFVSRDKTDVEVLLNFADARRHIALPNAVHLAQAQGIVQTALGLDPRSLRGRVMLMEVYSAGGLRTETRDAAEGVLALDPKDLRAHDLRVRMLIETNRDAEAVEKAREMASAHPDDLAVQAMAIGRMAEAKASTDTLAAFLEEIGTRFEGRLGLELLRATLVQRRVLAAGLDSPEAEALTLEFLATLERARQMPAQTPEEARTLVEFLDPLDPEASEAALARFFEDAALAPGLTGFAAERLWSRGDFAGAGAVVLEHSPDLSAADDASLGWLALSELPDAARSVELLRSRGTASAGEWVALHEAARLLGSSDPAGARRALPAADSEGPQGLVVGYLRGLAFEGAGDRARAVREWSRIVAGAPGWSIARDRLASAYIGLDRLLEARRTLRSDPRLPAGSAVELLRLEVLIDERGLQRESGADSYSLASRALERAPDMTELLALAARAALATGHRAEGLALADRVLGADLTEDPAGVGALADRLDWADADRAAALRERLAAIATDPGTVYGLAKADATAGAPERGRARLEARLGQAGETERVAWEAALAMYLDAVGDPSAREELLALSARYPTSLDVQLAVLQAAHTWDEPESMGVVMDRLGQIVGEDSAAWRVYRSKRLIAMIDPEDPNAREQATRVLLDLSAIANEDRSNAVAALTMARAMQLTGDPDRAADWLLRAARADPSDVDLQFELVETILPRAGRFEEARQQARELARLGLHDTGSLLRRAELLQRYGLDSEAAADWERAALSDDPGALIRMAMALADGGQADRGDTLVARALAREALPDQARMLAAIYLGSRGDPGRGAAELERLPERGPLGEREELLNQFWARFAESPDRARALEQRAESSRSPGAWSAAAHAYLDFGMEEDARRVTAAGLRQHPDAPDLTSLQRHFVALDTGDPTARLAYLRARRGLVPTPVTERIVALLDERLDGRRDELELIAGLRGLLDEWPLEVEVWEALATAQEAAGDDQGMAGTVRAALAALPSNPDIARFGMFKLDGAGMLEDALTAARQWRQRSAPPPLQADLAIALYLRELGRAREALDALRARQEQITRDRADQPGDAYLLATIMARAGEAEAARRLLSPLASDPEVGLRYCVGLTAFMPSGPEQRTWLEGLTPAALDSRDPAMPTELSKAWWQLASASGEEADTRRSVEVAEQLLAGSGGGNLAILGHAALGREALGELGRAADHYQEMLKLAPTLSDAHNNLAFLLLKVPDRQAEALGHADTAVRAAEDGNMPEVKLRSYLDTRAQVYLALGRAQDAAADYRTALETDPGWATGLVGLAEALEASGDREGAQAALDRLSALELSESQAARVGAIHDRMDD